LKLSQLAFACYLYAASSGFDKSYIDFLKATDYQPDLKIYEHRNALLIWLNSWGCRQFAIEYHEKASQEILSWYTKHRADLPGPSRNLWELTESEFASVGLAYESLSKRTASIRTKKNSTYSISIGPTGASKILFAIRPKALVPWDASIRQHHNHGNDLKSYIAYLQLVKRMLEILKTQCQKHGLQLVDLPKIFDRPFSSIPKLIDEYYWVTITNNWTAPSSETLLLWAKWDRVNL